jgi:hypothetical protein
VCEFDPDRSGGYSRRSKCSDKYLLPRALLVCGGTRKFLLCMLAFVDDVPRATLAHVRILDE